MSSTQSQLLFILVALSLALLPASTSAAQLPVEINSDAEFLSQLAAFDKEAKGDGDSQEAFCRAESGLCPGWFQTTVSCTASGTTVTCTDGSNYAECNGIRTNCPSPCASNGICYSFCFFDPDCDQCVSGSSCLNGSQCGSDGYCFSNQCICI
ncbi:MAG: hypothetical protein AAGD01_11610 [Acidobacteriota bacterium]